MGSLDNSHSGIPVRRQSLQQLLSASVCQEEVGPLAEPLIVSIKGALCRMKTSSSDALPEVGSAGYAFPVHLEASAERNCLRIALLLSETSEVTNSSDSGLSVILSFSGCMQRANSKERPSAHEGADDTSAK